MNAEIKALLQYAPTAVESSHGWFALRGGRLELRDTGVAITLCTKPGCFPYHLMDPDGRMGATGPMLQPLKDFGEQIAAERAEFFPKVPKAGGPA